MKGWYSKLIWSKWIGKVARVINTGNVYYTDITRASTMDGYVFEKFKNGIGFMYKNGALVNVLDISIYRNSHQRLITFALVEYINILPKVQRIIAINQLDLLGKTTIRIT